MFLIDPTLRDYTVAALKKQYKNYTALGGKGTLPSSEPQPPEPRPQPRPLSGDGTGGSPRLFHGHSSPNSHPLSQPINPTLAPRCPARATADSNHRRVPPALQRETHSAKVTHDMMAPPTAELSGSTVSRVGRFSGSRLRNLVVRSCDPVVVGGHGVMLEGL